jgi:LCP family protein required for cell wall assembly
LYTIVKAIYFFRSAAMYKWFRKAAKGDNDPEESPMAAEEGQQEEAPASGSDKIDKSAESKKSVQIEKKKPWSLKKKIIVTTACVLGAALVGAGIFLATILINPMGHFQTVVQQVSRTPAPSVSQAADETASPTPTPTLDPYGQLIAKSDFSILEHTVNILLIGVDYAPERDDWSGKHYFHSDVMIVLAINKETGSVNLISLPRDTYANIPGVDGIYKLNASMDCGGGWKDNPQEACKKVCEAASWMIGGIPINYYYAVDMSAVKGLVDAIDGVDFDIDVAFKMQGRSYSAGPQHMNGQAVLDYLRVRKELGDDSGDLNRINRQKNMLVAILQKLKDSGLIFKIPDIIGAFNGNLQTNVDLASTGALAAYAYSVDIDNIKLYSMDGSYAYHLFNWNFVITDSDKRVQIIRDVYGFDISKDEDVNALEAAYGITVPSYKHYSTKSALGLWEDMQIEVSGKAARPLLDQVKSILDADAALPPYPVPPPVTDPTLPAPEPVPSDGYRRYPAEGEVWALYNKAESEYSQIVNWDTSGVSRTSDKQFQTTIAQLQSDVQAVCSTFGIGADWAKLWHVDYGDHYYKTKVNQSYVKNEIPVDFN